MISTALVGAAFMVGDGLGWIEYLSGKKLDSFWVYFSVFVIFAIVVIARLVKLHLKIDEYEGQISFTATPTTFRVNYPLPDEPPLKKDEGSLYTAVRFEIWTNTDISTSKLKLNIVVLRNVFTRWYSLKMPEVKRVIGIPMEGSPDSSYRKKIRGSDPQPFEDIVIFRWRGKLDKELEGHIMPELALEIGFPKRIMRVYLDDPLIRERGSTKPL